MDLTEKEFPALEMLAPGDGLLLVQVDAGGRVYPHVLRLGLMTEGRLEQAIMPIYNEIVKHRTRLAQRVVADAKLGARV